MIVKILEICKENLDGSLEFESISYSIKKKIEFIFGDEWCVKIS